MKQLNNIPTENVGYEILEVLKSTYYNDVFVVLGFKEKINEYVTWEYRETSGFYWGHYFDDYRSAHTDLLERI